MGRVITAYETCDRCNKKMGEVVFDAAKVDEGYTEDGPGKGNDFEFSLGFDAPEGHPAPTSGSFEVLCDKCQVRVADCMAMALNLKVPAKRKKEDEPAKDAA